MDLLFSSLPDLLKAHSIHQIWRVVQSVEEPFKGPRVGVFQGAILRPLRVGQHGAARLGSHARGFTPREPIEKSARLEAQEPMEERIGFCPRQR